jgi:hypothetical protein
MRGGRFQADHIMCNMLRLGSAIAASLLCAAPIAAQTYDEQSIDASTCRDISGQAEIDGVMQPFVGRACQRSDGSWVLVNGDGDSWVAPVTDYAYPYPYAPGYWGAPEVWGPSFVFFDGFHHHRHFHHHPGHFVGMPSGFPAHPGHTGGGGHAWGDGHTWGGGHGGGGGIGRH